MSPGQVPCRDGSGHASAGRRGRDRRCVTDRLVVARRRGGAPAAGARRLRPAPPGGEHLDHRPGRRDGHRGARWSAAALRGAVHHPPDRGRGHRRRPGSRRPHRGRRPVARRGRGHRRHDRDRRAGLRSVDRPDRRGRHQARSAPVPFEGGPAGRHRPQDARRHGQRLAGTDHQAGRPPPQHAHPVGPARVEAAPDRPGDPRHLRTARAPPRDPGHQVAVGGPRICHPAPQTVRGDRADGRQSRSPSATSSWHGCWSRSASVCPCPASMRR